MEKFLVGNVIVTPPSRPSRKDATVLLHQNFAVSDFFEQPCNNQV